jgi:hypothetical protein
MLKEMVVFFNEQFFFQAPGRPLIFDLRWPCVLTDRLIGSQYHCFIEISKNESQICFFYHK